MARKRQGTPFWDMQNTLLEDIERIEVIRGSGATLWGANAVNGVINIITKSAKETQGGIAIAGIGNDSQRYGKLRYGGALTDDSYARGYLQYHKYEDFSVEATGKSSNDQWDSLQAGFKVEKQTKQDKWRIQGDIFRNH